MAFKESEVLRVVNWCGNIVVVSPLSFNPNLSLVIFGVTGSFRDKYSHVKVSLPFLFINCFYLSSMYFLWQLCVHLMVLYLLLQQEVAHSSLYDLNLVLFFISWIYIMYHSQILYVLRKASYSPYNVWWINVWSSIWISYLFLLKVLENLFYSRLNYFLSFFLINHLNWIMQSNLVSFKLCQVGPTASMNPLVVLRWVLFEILGNLPSTLFLHLLLLSMLFGSPNKCEKSIWWC